VASIPSSTRFSMLVLSAADASVSSRRTESRNRGTCAHFSRPVTHRFGTK
jgi:hypothetical protein